MKQKRAKGEGNTYSTVSIPAPLVDKIKQTIKGTGYVSVSDFVTDVIRTVLVAEKSGDVEEQVKQRLKSLGYLK